MKYDVVVIGGGPAGMMAAGRAGELGARVLLLEKKPRLGIKLLMTGNGRCNITNKILEPRLLIEKFGVNGKFLFSALSRFGTEETMDFFVKRRIKLKVEDNNRVLPQSGQAPEVLNALISYLNDVGVVVKTNAEVGRFVMEKQRIKKIVLSNGEEILADKFIIATGGKSYPQSGSTGDGYKWLKSFGHEIIEPKAALAPIILRDDFVKKLEGLSLSQIKLSLLSGQAKKAIDAQFGDMIFTKNGLSGPAALSLSRAAARAVSVELKILLDLFPEFTVDEWNKKIKADFDSNKNKTVIGLLEKIAPRRLVEVVLSLIKIDAKTPIHSITKAERQKIIDSLKAISLAVSHVDDFNNAMITVGGVKLSEIDQKTMKSKLVDNLYVAGEVLDLAGPTGGFNLQACWSTGYLAGESAAGHCFF